MFSNHSGIKLEINNRKKFAKHTDMQKLNNHTPKKNQWIKEEIKMDIRKQKI